MMNARDRTVAATGAILIALVLVGLMVVQARSGPYDEPLVQATAPVVVGGGVLTAGPTGTQAPGGVCVPPAGQSACQPARTTVELDVQGLPPLGADGRYAAFLVASDGTSLPLGPLEPSGDGLRVRYAEDVDGRSFEDLVVSLGAAADADAPGPFVALRIPLTANPGEATDLRGERQASLRMGTGTAHLNQIGAVSISAVAEATLGDVPMSDAWRYQAWLVPTGGAGDGGEDDVDPVSLGLLEHDGTAWLLDGRVERVDLGDHGRFEVRVLPASAAPAATPVGFPVVEARLG